MPMNYAEVLAALTHASDFELFRLRAAIDRVLGDPQRIATLRQAVRRGQRLQYFDPRENRLRDVQVLEMRHSNVVVLDAEVPVRLLIDYAALNLDGVDVAIRERGTRGLGRQEVAVGDVVGFQDRDGRQRRGTVQRLNTKTVTLDCDGQAWRVSYALLHRMIDGEP